MPQEKEQQNKRKKIEYNYFIDDCGLYYKSTIAGELYQEFDINGVCEISESIGIDILYLCYIDEDDQD